MQPIPKKWILLFAVAVVAILICCAIEVPPTWDVAELVEAEPRTTLQGLEFLLNEDASPFGATLVNRTDFLLESAAIVGVYDDMIFIPGLEVKLDGHWYTVPREDYFSAGIGLELAPGDRVSGKLSLGPYGYGRLPDGAYRVFYSAYRPDSPMASYTAYAYFDIQNRRYCLPGDS